MDPQLLGIFHNETLLKVSLVHPVRNNVKINRFFFTYIEYILLCYYCLSVAKQSFGKPDKEVHQVDDICDVVEYHPQVVGHVPEHGAGDHEEDVVQDSNGYHL